MLAPTGKLPVTEPAKKRDSGSGQGVGAFSQITSKSKLEKKKEGEVFESEKGEKSLQQKNLDQNLAANPFHALAGVFNVEEMDDTEEMDEQKNGNEHSVEANSQEPERADGSNDEKTLVVGAGNQVERAAECSSEGTADTLAEELKPKIDN
ncbi:hypothetical protein R1sor_025706 [Riccia sorocarpa]|uniref:Uncharacterized protein n=1 Tax=Riccia sorocarpa TaxID=122646 RepID=A0ABD3G9V7_9MARC